jgi:hypothetical protein
MTRKRNRFWTLAPAAFAGAAYGSLATLFHAGSEASIRVVLLGGTAGALLGACVLNALLRWIEACRA